MDGTTTPQLPALREAFFEALVTGDAAAAEDLVLAAATAGTPLADLYVDVVGPALRDVGDQWASGCLTVADEHLATGIAWDVMRLVGVRAATAPRRSRERVLLAAVGDENHVTGLRMIGDLADSHGFDVRYLGAALPVDTIAPMVKRLRPEFLGLSVTIPGYAEQVTAAVENVAALHQGPRGILVGGTAVPPALRRDPRVRYATDARAAIGILEELAQPV